MTLTQLIKWLEKQREVVGDVELYRKEDDGRSTYSVPFEPKRIVKEKIWKGHPDPARCYLKDY